MSNIVPSKIKIEFIPHKTHKFSTVGYWFIEGDLLTIQISNEICWQYKAAVLAHELIEVLLCILNGITTVECDNFDALFEKKYELGLVPKSVEPGFDRHCPYRKGHIWGCRLERFVIFLLKESW